jgi:hypothetical protein
LLCHISSSLCTASESLTQFAHIGLQWAFHTSSFPLVNHKCGSHLFFLNSLLKCHILNEATLSQYFPAQFFSMARIKHAVDFTDYDR